MQKLRILNESRKSVVADRVDIANNAATRNRGLLKHTGLENGEGLWIVPCEGVHTIGMKFPIDVVFLNKQKKIVKIRPAMPKWRLSFCLRAHSVLELPAGYCQSIGTGVGDQLAFEKYEM